MVWSFDDIPRKEMLHFLPGMGMMHFFVSCIQSLNKYTGIKVPSGSCGKLPKCYLPPSIQWQTSSGSSQMEAHHLWTPFFMRCPLTLELILNNTCTLYVKMFKERLYSFKEIFCFYCTIQRAVLIVWYCEIIALFSYYEQNKPFWSNPFVKQL